MKRSVVITGAARGIGFATARMLAGKGMHVIMLDRDAERLATAKNSIATGSAESYVLDLADAAAIEKWTNEYAFPADGLFGLVNNAAIEVLKPMNELTINDLESMWKVNMLAPVLMAKACYPPLKRAKGSIVNIGSIADSAYSQLYSGYGASKAFLHAFFKHACREIGFDGIRVNSISPGSVDTPLMDDVLARGLFDPADVAKEVAAIPMEQRIGRPEEIAEAVYFALTGPRYMHGADIRIHGGSNP